MKFIPASLWALFHKNLLLKWYQKRRFIVAELLVPILLSILFVEISNPFGMGYHHPLPFANPTNGQYDRSLMTIYEQMAWSWSSWFCIAITPKSHPLTPSFTQLLDQVHDAIPHFSKPRISAGVQEFDSRKAVVDYNHHVRPGKDRTCLATLDLTQATGKKNERGQLSFDFTLWDERYISTHSHPFLFELHNAIDWAWESAIAPKEMHALRYMFQFAIMRHNGYFTGETDAKNFDTLDLRTINMPGRSWYNSAIDEAVNPIIAGVFGLVFFGAATSIVSALVLERECMVRSTLLIMGASKTIIYITHFLAQFLTGIISVIVATGMIKWRMYPDASVFLIFTWMLLYLITTLSFCCFLSNLFTKAKTAVATTALVMLILALLSIGTNWLPFMITRFILAFNFQTTFSSMNKTLYTLWHIHKALDWSNVTESTEGSISLLSGFIIFFLQTILYGLLTIYVDNMLGADNNLKWWYPVSPLYWRRVFSSSHHIHNNDNSLSQQDLYMSLNNDADREIYSPDATHSRFISPLSLHEKEKIGIKVSNLYKDFDSPTGVVRAIDGLNLSFVRGQCSVLLGHNGAAKSTLTNCISRVYSPTSGKIEIYDKHGNLIDNPLGHIGITMQQNTLLDLTVMDHFLLFSKIKQNAMGITIPDEKVRNEAAILLNRLKIGPESGHDNKTNALPSTLSGGQKRKVCLALALLHDPEILLLDEPTTGCDVGVQREIWKILEEEKSKDGGKTIILLTHSLDEAEIGDRISIMVKGRVMCTGSSNFLKKAFNIGYLLTLDKIKQPGVFDRIKRIDTSANTNTDKKVFGDACLLNNLTTQSGTDITNKLSQLLPPYHFQHLSIHTDTQHNIVYNLPLEFSTEMGSVIEIVETNKSSLQITDMSLGLTSLLDVFLLSHNGYTLRDDSQFYHDDELNLQPQCTDNSSVLSINNDIWDRERVHVGAILLFFKQFWALFHKRLLISRRDLKSAFKLFFVPLLLLGVLCALYYTKAPPRSVELDYHRFPHQSVVDYNILQISTHLRPESAINANAFSIAFASYPEVTPFPRSQDQEMTNIIHWNTPETRKNLPNRSFTLDYRQYLKQSLNNTYQDSSFYHPRYAAINVFDAQYDAASHTASITADLWYNSTSFYSLQAFEQRFLETVALLSGLPPLSMTETLYGLQERILTDDFFKISAFLAVFCLAIIFPHTIIHHLVLERSTIRHLHSISGMTTFSYYTAYFTYDAIQFALMNGIFLGGLILSGIPRFDLWPVFYSLAIYFITMMLFLYLLSLSFKDPDSAQIFVVVLFVMGPFVSLGLESLLVMHDKYWRFLYHWNTGLPSGGLLYAGVLLILDRYRRLDHQTRVIRVLTHWSIFIPVYFFLLVGLEYCATYQLLERWFGKTISLKKRDNISSDTAVLAQEEEVKSGEWKNDREQTPLVSHGLRKTYSNFTAVNNAFFKVEKGSIFALLGANGAGKTSLISMLTGDLSISQSTGSDIHDAFILGHSITAEPRKGHAFLGYCPQIDALNFELTPRETFRLYSNLRGVTGELCELFVLDLLNVLGLEYAADRPISMCSGGMRRRVSLGLALSSNPEVIILDEAASSLDPISRRNIQLLLHQTCKNRCVLMTDHSISHIEALAQYIAIMSRGEIKALGTKGELKTKLGKYYALELQVIHGLEDFTACFVLSLLVNIPIDAKLAEKLDQINNLSKLNHSLSFSQIETKRNVLILELYDTPEYISFIEKCRTNGAKIVEKRSKFIGINLLKDLYNLSQLFIFLKKIQESIPMHSLTSYTASQISIEQLFTQIINHEDRNTEVSNFN